jgi:hypothetical protein
MAKVSRESAADVTDYGPAEDRGAKLDGYAAIFTSIREDWDLAPILKGCRATAASARTGAMSRRGA